LKIQSESEIKNVLKSSYSKEFADLLFSYPYIKIKVLEENGIAKRQTAATYLNKLATAGILFPVEVWKETYYINQGLMNILSK